MGPNILFDPIIVTGTARSGSSFLMGVLKACGLQIGMVCGATKENPKGQLENREIIDKTIKPFLRNNGYDPMGQKPLADPQGTPQTNELSNQIREIAKSQGIDGNKPWGFKCVKSAPIWPALAWGFPNAKWVIVRRDPADIAKSCLDARFMKAYRTIDEWVEWVRQHETFFKQIEWECDAFEVWPRKAMQGDLTELQELVEWLGLKWNEEAVREWMDPNLYRGI